MYNNKIINLTQHKATQEQIEAGVIDLPEEARAKLQKLLTFDDFPDNDILEKRTNSIYELVASVVLKENIVSGESYDDDLRKHNLSFMIGGAPFLMNHLEKELNYVGQVLYAFSRREVIEVDNVKTSIFKHVGFVAVPNSRITTN
jgi:hypothetical protein